MDGIVQLVDSIANNIQIQLQIEGIAVKNREVLEEKRARSIKFTIEKENKQADVEFSIKATPWRTK